MDTSDHEYPVILGSERENVDGIYRAEFRVAHDPPRLPPLTLPVRALTQSEAWRKVGASDTGRANRRLLQTRVARLSPVSDMYLNLRVA
jgi:hypothetical protein